MFDRCSIDFNKIELFYSYIRELIPMYYMSKKHNLKFEEVTSNTVMGLYGEYNGV